MEVLIITGMSGSGKSHALKILEDNGYYCLDNLPTELVSEVVGLMKKSNSLPAKIAVTMDTRNSRIADEAGGEIGQLKASGIQVKILFLDSDDSVLLKRYKESRRLHPLMLADEALDISGAIRLERELLSWLRQNADYIIDTSLLTTVLLRDRILTVLNGVSDEGMILNFVAFGYKYGVPADADLVFDVRCLPNPYYVRELSQKTGFDTELREYVMSFPESKQLFEKIVSYLDFSIPLYIREGKSQLVVGLGCTGGQHRSLTFAYLLSEYFEKKGIKTKLVARDTNTNLRDILSR